MLIKRICAAVIACAIAISGSVIAPAAVSAEEDFLTVNQDILTGDDVYRLDENALDITGSNLEYSEENNRLYDHNIKMSWGTDNVMFKFFNAAKAAEKFHTDDYSYINAWIYNPEIKKDNQNRICNLIWVLRTGRSANDVSGMYYYIYNIPMDWEGWKLVSVPIADFANGKLGSNLDYGIYCISLEVNGWTNVMPVWPDEENYSYVDAMWFSKTKPAQELSVKSASYELGAGFVSADLGGENTYVFEMSSQLAQSTLEDSVVIKKDKEILEEGYNILADGNLIKVVFDNELEKGSTYDISLSTSLSDIYGNRLDEEYITNFTVEAPGTLFMITETSVESGAENVPLDLGGDRVISVSFNNPVSEAEIMQNMSVLCNGLKLYDAYAVEIKDNSVYITMNDSLEAGAEYTVEFDESLCDIHSNTIIGDRSFSFTAAEVLQQSGLIWEYTDQSTVSTSSNLVHNNENNRRNNDNARMLWGTENVMFSFFYTNKAQEKMHINDYRYINAWIYNPEIKKDNSNKISNLIWILRTGQSANDVSGMYYYIYNIPMDWEGWKLISVPIADFANGKEGSSLDYGIYRISLEVNGWTGVIPGWTEESNYADVDMMWFSKTAPNDFVYVGSSFPQEYDGIPVRNAEFKFTYTNELSHIGQVSLQKDGTVEEIETAVTTEDNCVTVQVTESLEPDTDYTLKIGNDIYDVNGQQPDEEVEYSFTTEAVGLTSGKPVFAVDNEVISELPESGTEITVTSDLYNYSQLSQNAVLVSAQYDGYGNMIDMAFDSQEFGEGEGQLSVTVERKPEAVAVKAFVTEDMTEWNLLRCDYSIIGTEQKINRKVYPASASGSYGITLDKAELYISELRVSGTSKGAEPVLIELKNESGENVLSVPVHANAEGIYTYDYTFGGNLESGVYTLTAYIKGIKTSGNQILYFDADDRNTQLSTVNTTSDWRIIAELLSDNKSGFGIVDFSDAKINGMAKALLEQRPYEGYVDLLNMISNITSTLDLLNSTGWAGLGDFIKDNNELLLYDSSDYSYYIGLSEKNMNKINQSIAQKLPVESFEAFREVFEEAVADYKQEKNNNQGSSNGGTGGGGGGGGGSVSSSGGSREVFINPEADNTKESIFTDLETSLWAKESILSLYDKKIISASDDKLFRPEDKVTREEFVKLLVCAFEIEPVNEESGFSDTVAGAWYETYLASAKAMGISEGNSDGSFGVGRPITRQDMAAMLYRAVNALGKTLKSTVTSQKFIDDAEISDYANEAVKAMQGAGIINGMEDGSFRPLENCTRAQAAKVIAGLLNTLE